MHDRLRGAQDGRRRAIVLREHDHRCIAKVFAKAFQDIVNVRAAPGVDRLHGRTDTTQVAITPYQMAHELVLREGRVLEFVNRNVAKQVLIKLKRV